MTSSPPPVHLPVPIPQAAEMPVRWRFRPRWPAAVLLILWVLTAAGISFVRQQDARALAGAQAQAVAAGAAARLEMVTALLRAAAASGDGRGTTALSAAAAAMGALAPDDWLGLARTDAYGGIAESRGTVLPTAPALRAAIIAARPTVRVDTLRDGGTTRPVVVIAVPLPGPGLTESVIAAVLHPRFWRLDRDASADAADAVLLSPGCTRLAGRPADAGVIDAGRCRQRLAAPAGDGRSGGLGRLGAGGSGAGMEWGEVALHPVPLPAAVDSGQPDRGQPDRDGDGGGWVAAVPVRAEASAAMTALWCLGPAAVLLLGIPPGVIGQFARRWRSRRA